MAPELPNRRTVVGLALVVLTGLVSLLAAPSLPAEMTTHWNAAGTPDDTLPKSAVLVGGPAFVLGMVLLFEAIPRVDPLAGNIAEFQDAYDALAVLVAGFMAYTYGFVVAWNLGYEVAVEQALAPAIAVLFVAVGFLLERAERNWFVGIRTPWTLSSETVWRHTHDRAATLFKLGGVVALGGLVLPEYFVYFVIVPAAGVSLFAFVYSYLDYRRVGDGDPADAAEGGH